MSRFQLDQLRAAHLIEPGERIIYFYSAGLWSVLEDGNLLTEGRVISYARSDGDWYYASARYDELCDLGVEYASWPYDSRVIVYTVDGQEIPLAVSPGEGPRRGVRDAPGGAVAAGHRWWSG